MILLVLTFLVALNVLCPFFHLQFYAKLVMNAIPTRTRELARIATLFEQRLRSLLAANTLHIM